MTKAQKKAHANYERKRVQKLISFNTETERELLDYVESIDNFSQKIKQYLSNEMKKEQQE